MASIKVKYRPSATNGKEGSIYYQIIHGRTASILKKDVQLIYWEFFYLKTGIFFQKLPIKDFRKNIPSRGGVIYPFATLPSTSFSCIEANAP